MTPIVAQSSLKIEPPNPFTKKSDDDIKTWFYTIDLNFKAENQILQGQIALRVALNLMANAAIWFSGKNADLDTLSWAELKEHLGK